MEEHFIISFAHKGRQYDLDTRFVNLGSIHQYHIHLQDKTLMVEFKDQYSFHTEPCVSPSKENYKKILEAVIREIEEYNNVTQYISVN